MMSKVLRAWKRQKSRYIDARSIAHEIAMGDSSLIALMNETSMHLCMCGINIVQ